MVLLRRTCCLLLLLLLGCGDSEAGSPAALRPGESLFVSQPTVRPNPMERAPLIAIVDVQTSHAVDAFVEVSDGQHSWEQPWKVDASQHHSIAVMGLRPNREHKMRVRVRIPGTDQDEFSQPLSFRTDPLPETFPPLRTIISNPELMEPGVTFFAVNLWRDASSVLDYGYIIALDSAGEVVWYCNTTDRIADMRVMQNGHLLYQQGSYRYAYEIDLLGQDHRRWVATNLTEIPSRDSIPVAIDTSHHDLIELPKGNFMTLATELKEFDAYPTSEFDADAPWEPAHVVCDSVVEFRPDTGEIKDELHLINVLDRKRFGYMALGGFWKDKYNDRINDLSRDWSHANALVYLADENAILVSFRHQDCVMKIDWGDKKIRWILGDPEGWGEPWQPYLLKPKGELEWTYHQHSPQITPEGTLMMYDNGNYRARPFHTPTLAPDNQSRIVEFRIDETAMTVEQIFEYRGTPQDRFYCPFYCEADWLPITKNILVTDGGHIELQDGTPSDDVPAERQWARIFEITRSEPPNKVFEVRCDSGLGSPYGWSIYRANRFTNLYDGFSLVPPQQDAKPMLFDRGPHVKKLD